VTPIHDPQPATSRVAFVTERAEAVAALAADSAWTTDRPVARWREEYTRIDPTKVVEELAAEGFSVVCLGPGLTAEVMLEVAEAFDRSHPEIMVLIAAELSSDEWIRAMRAGVRDIVAPGAIEGELPAAVRRALGAAALRRANLVGEPLAPSSRMITVLSPKGGAGKTTIATNLAVALADRRPGSTALVDLDVQFGDVSAALQLTPVHTLADVGRANGSVDTTTLKVFLSSHRSGLYVLCAPDAPAEADDITAATTTEALRLLGADMPYVVVDTAAGLDEAALGAIELSSDILLVCTLDVVSVRSLRKEIDALDALGMTGSRRHLVVNRADNRVGLTVQDVQEVIGMEPVATLPSSPSVALSMNSGSPVVEADRRSPVGRELLQLAERFAEAGPVDDASGGGRGWWKRGLG
jgi:pilus assembly protein CpaE